MSDEGPLLPRFRRRPLPAGAAVVVVRGDDLGQDSDRRQAKAFRLRWPEWHRFGLSAYFAEDDDAIADLAADQLEPSRSSASTASATSLAAGIEVVPTFRSPHVTLAFTDLDTGLSALQIVEHETRANPYHGS